jgi:murein DD-endopeptidase MepM/ murein hydrolase activator NlpD
LLIFSLLVALLAASVANGQESDSLQSVERIVELSREGERLRSQLGFLDELIDDNQNNISKLKKSLQTTERQISKTEKNLKTARERFEQSQTALQIETLAYIELANQLGQQTPDADTSLLSYAADSKAQDAVLVYQTASGILETRGERMSRLRQAARERKSAELLLQTNIFTQKKQQASQEISLAELKETREEIKAQSSQASKDWKAYQKTERRYSKAIFKATGQKGSLLDSSFGDGESVSGEGEGALLWPVTGSVSSGFNPRRCLGGICRPHTGIDIAVPAGTKVQSPADGKVTVAGVVGGYGNFVCVEHSSRISSCSAHLGNISVEVGDEVRQSSKLGESGCTGRCFGPHVHFEIRKNKVPIDPATIILSS